MKIIETDSFYIKASTLPHKVLKQLEHNFTFRFYNERACNSCEYLNIRHSDICDNCAAFLAEVRLASVVNVGKNKYLKLPIGDKEKVTKQLKRLVPGKSLKFVNKQTTAEKVPFKKKIKFKYKSLKDYQVPAVKAMLKTKKGVLKSAPRTGKTVMTSAVISKIGGKTIILAAQRTWLEGFYETFCGSKTQKGFTNATGPGITSQDISAWKKAKRPYMSIGFAKDYEDFLNLDICLCTYQTFLSDKGTQLLEKIKNMFAVMVIDEVHTANADRYSGTVSKLNCEYKLGLSGTPERKDQKEVIVEHLIGPILHETEVEQLKPTVRFTKTDFTYTSKYSRWDQKVSSIENDKKRNKLIAKTAIRDAKSGHLVIIPYSRVDAVDKLVNLINKLANRRVAASFHGKVSKDKRIKLIQAARNYKVKILVGNIKMLSTGINIPRASCLYEVTLSSNIPNAEQRFKRILTPYEDKPPPMIRYFLDNMGVRRNCMRNEFWNCLIPKVKPIMSDKDMELMKHYLSNSSKASGIIQI